MSNAGTQLIEDVRNNLEQSHGLAQQLLAWVPNVQGVVSTEFSPQIVEAAHKAAVLEFLTKSTPEHAAYRALLDSTRQAAWNDFQSIVESSVLELDSSQLIQAAQSCANAWKLPLDTARGRAHVGRNYYRGHEQTTEWRDRRLSCKYVVLNTYYTMLDEIRRRVGDQILGTIQPDPHQHAIAGEVRLPALPEGSIR